MRDDKGFTLLHHAVLKQQPQKLLQLIDFARNTQAETDEDIRKWMNAQTLKDKFTALHFASFKGNLNSIKILVENGADVFMEN
jgi:ankyrin repeat protein